MYVQNISIAGNGLLFPIHKLTISVNDVMVMETAASESMWPVLSGTSMVTGVLRQAANITYVSSIPIPMMENHTSSIKKKIHMEARVSSESLLLY